MLFRIVQNADARRTVNFVAAQIKRHGKFFLDAFGDVDDFFMSYFPSTKNRKFVAAETRDDIGRAQTIAQTFGNPDQQFVADQMTETVVDEFETVEINKQNAYFMIRIFRRLFPAPFRAAA